MRNKEIVNTHGYKDVLYNETTQIKQNETRKIK